MKTTKKLLSVILAVIMIMSSMSVCFGVSLNASAVSDENLQALADAILDSETDVLKNMPNYFSDVDASGSSGSGKNRINKFRTQAKIPTYAEYAELLNIVQKFIVVFNDGYPLNYPDGDNGENRTCTDFVKLKDDVITALKDGAFMTAQEITDYKVNEFLSRLLYPGTDRSNTNGWYSHSGNNRTESNVPAEVHSIMSVTTEDRVGYMNSKSSIDAVEKPVALGFEIDSAMYRKTYKTGSFFGMGGTQHYHNVFCSSGVTPFATNYSVTTDSSEIKNTLVGYQSSFAEMNLAQYTTEKLLDMLTADSTSLDALKADIDKWRSDVIGYVGSEATYKKFYASEEAQLQATLTAIAAAKNSQVYFELAEKWRNFMDAHPDYGTYNYGAFDEYTIKLDYKNFYNGTYKAIDDPAMYEYLDSKDLIDNEYFVNFTDNVKVYDLRDSKAEADALYEANKDTYKELSYDEKVALKSQLVGYINAIKAYSAQVVNSIYPDGGKYLELLRDEVDCEINDYVLWFTEKMSISYIDYKTADIQALIAEIPAQLTGLQGFYNQIKGSSGEDKAQVLLGDLLTKSNAFTGELYKLLGDRFTAEVIAADELYTAIGRPTTLTLNSFLQLKVVFDGIEADLLTYIDDNGYNSVVTAETRAIYDALKVAVYDKYLEFAASYGFAYYEKSKIEYEARNDYENDKLKGDYADFMPTEANLNTLITKLDSFLGSKEFAELVGIEGGLGGLLKTTVSDLIYTDDLINTVVNLLYPLVLGKFEEVWAGLPTTVKALGMDVKVRYVKSLQQVLESAGLQLYPQSVAALSPLSNYPEIKTALESAKNWESVSIYDKETKKLKFVWGVTDTVDDPETTVNEKEEAFYDAFSAAMEGLKPLVFGLLCGKAWSPSQVDDIATGTALGTDVGVDLQLGTSANDGYVNFLGAAFEALGMESPYTASQMTALTTTEQVARAIFEPIFGLLDKIGKAPLDTILTALPNLVYALSFNMITPLLSMLQIDVTYDAKAIGISAMSGAAHVDVGKELDLNEMLGIDFSKGISALLGLLGIELPGLDTAFLAAAGTLKEEATVRTNAVYDRSGMKDSSKAYFIDADKADIVYYILTYIVGLIENPEAIYNILGAFIKDEAELEKIKGTIGGILEMLQIDDANDVAAALIELIADPQTYSNYAQYDWYEAEVGGDIEGITPADLVYLTYGNNWSEDTAKYVTENLNNIIAAIVTMIDADATFDLGAIIGDAIGGLFTAKTVNDLAAKLLELLQGEDVASVLETVAPILDQFIGINIDDLINKLTVPVLDENGEATLDEEGNEVREAKVWTDEEVYDADSFVAVLMDLISVLQPVLDFLLDGEDLTITLNNGNTVVLKGCEGYSTALVPLLEALGYEDDELVVSGDTLTFVLKAVLGVIDGLTGDDAINAILDLLPGVFYYLASNALSTGVENLLHGVYAILDVIRPVIDVDLRTIIKDATAELEINGNKIGAIDIETLGIGTITNILNAALGLNFASLQDIIYDVCSVIATNYDSASSLDVEGVQFKKGMYNANFENHDMITVIISYVLDWLKADGNAAAIEKLLKDKEVEIPDGLLNAVIGIFNGTTVENKAINYGYFAGENDLTDAYYAFGINVYKTSLGYPTDWTEETAKYFNENLSTIVDAIIAMINKDKEDAPKTLGELASGLTDSIYTKENVEAIRDLVAGLIESVDAKLLEAAGVLLNVNVAEFTSYEVGEVTDGASFATELATLLNKIPGLLNWLLFGADYKFLYSDPSAADAIVINGNNGYAKGLVPILEALGVELPEGNDVETILKAVFTRLDAILANPIDEVLDILPNVIYFINANGVGACVHNILAPVNALLEKINPLLGDSAIDLNKTIEDAIGINLNEVDFAAIIELVEGLTADEETGREGLDLSELEELLDGLVFGTIEKYTTVAGDDAYRMVCDNDMAREDLLTVVLTIALITLETEGNAAVLDEMLNTNGVVGTILNIIKGVEIGYNDPNWGYAYSGDDLIDYAITYPNDWTDDTADYVYNNIDGIIAAILDLAKVTPNNLSDLLKGLLVKDGKHVIYNADNVIAIRDLVANLLKDIDATLIEAAGKLLDADINAFAKYEVGEVTDGASFATELAGLLETIPGLVDWLLFNKDYKFFVDETKVDGEFDDDDAIITINGAKGYANGLALILEALGVELNGVTGVENILKAVFARLDEILANPVDEIFGILPNVIYFINAGGIEASIDNLTVALVELIKALEPLGIKLELAELINLPKLLKLTEKDADKEWLLSIDNLSIDAIVEAVTALTGLNLTEAQNVLKNFALGTVTTYNSVSDFENASKMVYTDDFSKRDMLTVLITTVILVAKTEGNAAALDKLIGKEIVSSILTVMSSTPVVYAAPDWEYCWNGTVENGTVDVMKYAITYPNNWTEESAIYVAENLGEIGDTIASLIDSNYASLSDLIADKVTIYSSENIQAIVDAIAGLLKDIDTTLISAAGKLLGADIAGLAEYKAPAGIDTAEEFSAELANVLTTYAGTLLDWLLFGKNYKFFVDKAGDAITINGAYGYAEGLALVLEALGCENLPDGYDVADSKAAVKAILDSAFARLDEILANPVDEVFAILPNVLYFLNTNGVAIAIDNLTAGLTALLDKLEAFDIRLDLNSLIDIPKLLKLEGEYKISIDNLTMEAIIELVAALTGLNLDKLDDILTGFALGEVKEYTSVSTYGKTYKMYYNDEFAKYDMVTVLANVVLLVIKDEANATKLVEMMGEKIYSVILNIFTLKEVPVQEFDWKFTDKADTDHVFSALNSSELYEGFGYGTMYTEEKAQYVADNFGEFVDNIIYLLGIEVGGENVNNLSDLLNGLVNGNLYNSKNLDAIRDAIIGLVNDLAGIGGGAGKHIIAVLKSSLGVDLNAYSTMTFEAFDNDRAKFEAGIRKIAAPIYPVLKWLLADEDFTFFVDEAKTDLITLNGAEGYAYGIIPLLEVLDCKNIMTSADYCAAVEADSDVLINTILTPLLDRVDVILANPGDEILGMLPNLIYFINSNGVDTVVKNTLNSVYALLNAIEPIAKIDLYALIGLDLSTLTFEKLFEMLLDLIAEKTGYEFENLDANAVAELTTGKLVSYTSANGKKAYKMVYQSETAKAETVTVVERLLITFIMHENNQEALIGLLKDNFGMSEDAEKYMRGILKTIADASVNTQAGMDMALATIYYVYYGLDLGAGEAAGGIKDLNKQWQDILKDLGMSEDRNEATVGNAIADILDLVFEDVFTSDGLAPNGFIAFFQKIVEFFQKIADFFKNLF